MSPAAGLIRKRLANGEAFPADEIQAIIGNENNLDLWSAAYEVLRNNEKNVTPPLKSETVCQFALGYLLHCVRANPSSDNLESDVHSGYEAAWELAWCLKVWGSPPIASPMMSASERALREAYLQGDDNVRDRIINGTLEHAFESPQVRAHFEHWAHDPELNRAWALANEWAKWTSK